MAVLLGFMGFILFRAPPKPNPPNEAAFGCYQTRYAPNLLLDQRGLVIDQPEMNPALYRLDRAKIGIILIIDDPIDLRQTPIGYRFAQSIRGTGRSYPFVYRTDTKAYYTFDENDLSVFQVTANDGVRFEYRRQPRNRCG